MTRADRPSRTVLIGWELGGGAGHLRRLQPILVALAARGWRVVAFVKDPAEARLLWLSDPACAGLLPGRLLIGQASSLTRKPTTRLHLS